MGSKGQKPRKGKHPQHLPKVGTATENERLLHEERSAILDTMGMGGAPAWLKTAIAVIGILLLVGAILALVVLN
ncbi:MAG: hypothetical protein FJW86_11835 [Actinobacteria bacterium]|nr:hypothetical protein [Actinomycetota bacterium]MBM3675023.1 hypothetical protein [Actinomycetota bacterium]